MRQPLGLSLDSMYFLPELIIEEIIKRSDEKERQKLDSILSSIKGKPEVFKNVDERFKNQFTRIKYQNKETVTEK